MHEKGLKKLSLRDSEVRDSLIYTYFPVSREWKQAIFLLWRDRLILAVQMCLPVSRESKYFIECPLEGLYTDLNVPFPLQGNRNTMRASVYRQYALQSCVKNG